MSKLSYVAIAGPNVPCCPTGTSIFTIGALLPLAIRLLYELKLEETATVKSTVVVTLFADTEVREGTTKALDSTGNILGGP